MDALDKKGISAAQLQAVRPHAGTVVTVTSGKGGVGKTTSSAALGAALAMLGDKVVVIDFDIGLRKLDLVLGAERQVIYDIVDVIEKRATLAQSLIEVKEIDGLYLLPASQAGDKNALTGEGVQGIISDLSSHFRWIICDSPAGIEMGARMAMHEADIAVVVVNAEVSSIRDSDRVIGLLDTETRKALDGEILDKRILVTRYDPERAKRGKMMTIAQIEKVLGLPVMGVIGESEDVLDSSNIGRPVTFAKKNSATAKAYMRAARALRGEADAGERRSWLARLLGRG